MAQIITQTVLRYHQQTNDGIGVNLDSTLQGSFMLHMRGQSEQNVFIYFRFTTTNSSHNQCTCFVWRTYSKTNEMHKDYGILLVHIILLAYR